MCVYKNGEFPKSRYNPNTQRFGNRSRAVFKFVPKTILFLFLAMATNCLSPRYYVPSANVPLMRKQGDLKASGVFSTSGIDLHAAYAFYKHIAVAASGSFPGGGKNNEENSIEGFGALGAFFPFSTGGVFEMYGGAGGGRYNVAGAHRQSQRYYGQFNLGYTSSYFDIAFLTQIAYTKVSAYDDWAAASGVSFEPGVLLRLGIKNVKLESQLMLPISRNQHEDLKIVPLVFSLGVHTAFDF
ncbi:MAG: hypothetical protein LDLANPLL_00097 [Turneriella sp.]|nr:hypothetical protein [Turneriella sp.]